MKRLNLLYLSTIILTLSLKAESQVELEYPVDALESNRHIEFKPNFPIRFFKRVKYSLGSIKCFLKHTYNDKNYAEQFLPLNFDHMLDFLSHVDKSEDPKAYIESVINLFGKKLKEVNFVNSFAFLELIEKLILLEKHFNIDSDITQIKEDIKEILRSFLNTRIDLSYDLNQTAEELYNIVIDQDKTTEIFHLRYVIDKFLETGLSKLIWSPIDQEDCWNCVKLTACQLEYLFNKNIITKDMLNELYWTLICRFKYFLDTFGMELSARTYMLINSDLENDDLALWSLQEKEPFILSKREFLRQSIMSNAIAAHISKEGVFNQQ